VYKNIFLGILFLFSFDLSAQGLEANDNGAFNFHYANDVSGMTDQYYTNGVCFDLTLPIFSKSPFSLSKLNWQDGTISYHTLNFRYDVYTPDLNKELYSDRPFSAVMMLGSLHQYVLPKNIMISSEMRIGMIGQATGAGRLQNGIHKILPGADEVVGWETQIKNDIAINYIFSVDKQVHRSEYAEIILGGTVYLGSPYTKVEPHLILRLGLMEDYFNLLNSNPQNKWQAFIYSDFKPSYVAYNAMLQGGPLNSNNVYVLTEIERFVLDIEVGFGVTYKSFTIKAGQHYITPEFVGAIAYSWGEINFMFTF
jgi:hypothetical protein